MCNSKLFMDHGFVDLENTSNELPVYLPLNYYDPLYKVKSKYFYKHTSKEFNLTTNLKTQDMHDFISWVRYTEFEGEESELNKARILKTEAEFPDWSDNKNPWGLENEIKVWQKIGEVADERLARYPTTYDEDAEFLKNVNAMTKNHRNCVKLRMGEK